MPAEEPHFLFCQCQPVYLGVAHKGGGTIQHQHIGNAFLLHQLTQGAKIIPQVHRHDLFVIRCGKGQQGIGIAVLQHQQAAAIFRSAGNGHRGPVPAKEHFVHILLLEFFCIITAGMIGVIVGHGQGGIAFPVVQLYGIGRRVFIQHLAIQRPAEALIPLYGVICRCGNRKPHGRAVALVAQQSACRFPVVIGAVSTVAGILIAQFIGAEESKEAWCSFDVSLICGIVISALFLLAAGGFPSQILGLYTKDMSIINTGAVYFKIVAFSYISMAVSNILSSWLRCREHATIPFWAGFGAVAVNTGLNYLLIFGKLGFSCMGIKGAAIATLISQLFNLVFIVIGFVLCTRKDGDKPVLSLHFKKITIRDYLVMIMPILISEFLWSLGQNVESAVYGHLGTSNLAAYICKWRIVGVYTLLTTEELFRLAVSLIIFRKRKWIISLC